jgi:hypothetical protein
MNNPVNPIRPAELIAVEANTPKPVDLHRYQGFWKKIRLNGIY